MTARAAVTVADVVPAYANRLVGGYGIRGWRVHCQLCGYLSGKVYMNKNSANNGQRRHRCPT